MPRPTIAVTGATGFVGGRTAARLAARGTPPRLVVRDASRAPSLDGADVRVASGYGDREGMRAALEGVHTLFLVPAEESEDRVEQHRTAVDAAVDAGVQRIVYLSYIGASSESTFLLGRHHAATEDHIRATGLPWTFPRMNLYLDFVPSMVSPGGVIAGPAGDGRLAAVARDDVAAVAAEILLAAGGYDGQSLDLTGREAFTLAEAAAELSRLGGMPIRFRDETQEEARASRAGYGAPDWMVEAWISTYTAIAAGDLAAISDTVERLTGRPPVTLAEYAREHPDCLAHVTAEATDT